MQFLVVFEKFARAYLFQIALEIIWLPIQIGFAGDYKWVCLRNFVIELDDAPSIY